MNANPENDVGESPASASKTEVKGWLEAILKEEKLRPPALSKVVGVAASTLYRILDDDDPFTPTLKTINQIEAKTGYPFRAGQPPGFSEPEAIRLLDSDIPQTLRPAANEGVWRIGSRLIELAGYLPGDLVLFEIGAPAKAGDLVLAQIEDRTGGAETVIRLYDPPYLTVRTIEPGASTRPVPVDGERVRIVGRARRMLRVSPD